MGAFSMRTKKIVLSVVFLALGLLMPFIAGQIPEVGNMLLPMHIPVLVCGYVCGWQYGLAVGVLAPLLRSVLFSTPPFFPRALCMAFELGTYGLVVGLMYRKMRHKKFGIYISLLVSMVAGRVIWGIAAAVIYRLAGMSFGLEQFFSEAVVNAAVGMAVQLVLVPLLIFSLEKSGLIDD